MATLAFNELILGQRPIMVKRAISLKTRAPQISPSFTQTRFLSVLNQNKALYNSQKRGRIWKLRLRPDYPFNIFKSLQKIKNCLLKLSKI